jgi:hypothetical protein
MIRSSTAFASLAALALAAGAAQAQAPRDGTAAALDGNVVGGGIATLSGGGDDATVTYSAGGAGGGMAFHSHAGPGRRLRGTDGDGPVVRYSAPPTPTPAARRGWWAAADDAEVVYIRPR